MFRIRRVYDCTIPEEQDLVAQVQETVREQFPTVDPQDIEKLPDQLRNPLKYVFRSILFVADDGRAHLRGFAHVLHAPDLRFCFLDFISAVKGRTGGGVGGALYERVREEASKLGAQGLFFECLPDEPGLCPDAKMLRENEARLRFYERYGARPIINTAYETPLNPGDSCPPYLVFDSLGTDHPLSRLRARSIVRAILERKYGSLCSPQYTQKVVASFQDDPVRLRARRYAKPEETPIPVRHVRSAETTIALVLSERHHIHHVRERGYVEAPVRIASIRREIEPTGLFEPIAPRHFSEEHIRAVHDRAFVEFLKRVCHNVEPGKSVYPYVFPIRNPSRPPKELLIRAGYYCIDTFTPLNRNAYLAATAAVDCALTAAAALSKGHLLAYALVRPPGHHAERRSFGGFCYFNSGAVAAQYLVRGGKVAVLDIDYHHGNGTQMIFYDRPDVLTVSIHGHPNFAYPYFSGFADEKGEGPGEGYNVNFPLPERVDGESYREVLSEALRRIAKFSPRVLVLSLGLDTAKGDPTGSWSLGATDFLLNGQMIGRLRIPTLVVQEGGYRIRTLGVNARNFFQGLWEGAMGVRLSGLKRTAETQLGRLGRTHQERTSAA